MALAELQEMDNSTGIHCACSEEKLGLMHFLEKLRRCRMPWAILRNYSSEQQRVAATYLFLAIDL